MTFFLLNFDPVKEILKKWFFWGKYKWQWKLSLHHSSSISFWTWTEKTCGTESHQKETEHIHTSTANLLHIRIGNFNWCKCGHCKIEAREVDCLHCRGVDAMLFPSTKILESKGSILPPSFYAQLLVTPVSLIYLVDEFCFLFLVQLNELRMLGEYKVLFFLFLVLIR